jgi:hypothetical protein
MSRSLAYGFASAGVSELHARVSNLFNQRYSTAAQLGPTGFDANGVFQITTFPGG